MHIEGVYTSIHFIAFCTYLSIQRTLTYRGKDHCTTDLLFILFGFSCFAFVELAIPLLVWSNPNQSNRMSAVQGPFPPMRECSLINPLKVIWQRSVWNGISPTLVAPSLISIFHSTDWDWSIERAFLTFLPTCLPPQNTHLDKSHENTRGLVQ